jgi:hypothetical protein
MLAAVSVTPAGGTWVAGTVSRGSMTQPYIARRRGGGWQRQVLPPLGEAALADILVTSDDSGWAVGYRQAASGVVPLVLRWDGVSWRSADTSGLDSGAGLLMGVSRGEGGRPSVVGAAWADAGARFVGLVGRLAEGAWSSSLLGTLPGPIGLLALDVDGTGKAWVTGRASGVGVTAHTCATISPARARARTVRQRRRAEAHAAEEAAPDAHRHQAVRLPRPRKGLAPVPRLRTAQEVAAGALTIRDRTLRSGLPSESPTWGAVVADFDGDGRDDIFLGRHGSRARLYLDRGRRYRDAGVYFGRGDRHGCAAADVDGNGSLDLYCAFGGMRGTGIKANQLWLDPGGPAGALDPRAGQAPEPLGRGRVVAFLDVDGDGLKDLFVGHETNRVDGLPSGNRVYLRDGPARFRALKRSGIATDLAAWAVDSADVDRDGRPDLLLVYHDPKAAVPTSGIRLYRNTGGRFRDVTGRHRIRSIGERDAALARLDGDGRVDLVQLSAARIRISLQRQGRFVNVYERRVAGGVAVGVGDVDGDGDLDLYILRQKSRRTDKDVLLLNGGAGRSWRAVSVPSRHGGRADDVLPIDHDQNGLMDFLVLNGAGPGKGPIQLIAFYR